MQEDLVAHVQSPHELQDRNLQREVEGGDNGDRPKGPAHTVAHLADVIAGDGKAPGQEADLVPAKVFQELLGHNNLPSSLGVAFGGDAHDELGEEVLHLLEETKTVQRGVAQGTEA